MDTKEPGTWEAPPKGSGIFPLQRLIVVTVTYGNPSAVKHVDQHHGKIVSSWETLRYGSKQDFVNGFDALISTPLLDCARHHLWLL